MECERCGSKFKHLYLLKKHLSSKVACLTTKSITSRNYLLKKLETEVIECEKNSYIDGLMNNHISSFL